MFGAGLYCGAAVVGEGVGAGVTGAGVGAGVTGAAEGIVCTFAWTHILIHHVTHIVPV